MFFRKLETTGLAHYSYIVGSEGEAIIIDPMRDSRKYLEVLKEEGLQLKYIFETHRNEDYITGSPELSKITGASIYVSGEDDLEYKFGKYLYDGDIFKFGDCSLHALHTPGHTKGHMAYVLYEQNRKNPYMVFTGDLLFMGDVGRTDFYGEENLEKMTGLMYDSLFKKLLPLGDEVIVNPAHGEGSACGDNMDDRPITTIGYERQNNPKLQLKDKEEFIKNHGKMRIKPRYFEKMEICNLEGAPFVYYQDKLEPIDYSELKEEYVIVDLRAPEAYLAAHIPGSYFLSLGNLASFLGTILNTETPIVFLAEDDDINILREAYWTAKRIGFDHIVGYLRGGIRGFINNGEKWRCLQSMSAENYCTVDDGIKINILNVEKVEDIGTEENGVLKLPLKVLYKNLELLDKNQLIHIICNSGNTATTAGSYLVNRGYNVVVIAGGMQAIKKVCR